MTKMFQNSNYSRGLDFAKYNALEWRSNEIVVYKIVYTFLGLRVICKSHPEQKRPTDFIVEILFTTILNWISSLLLNQNGQTS